MRVIYGRCFFLFFSLQTLLSNLVDPGLFIVSGLVIEVRSYDCLIYRATLDKDLHWLLLFPRPLFFKVCSRLKFISVVCTTSSQNTGKMYDLPPLLQGAYADSGLWIEKMQQNTSITNYSPLHKKICVWLKECNILYSTFCILAKNTSSYKVG